MKNFLQSLCSKLDIKFILLLIFFNLPIVFSEIFIHEINSRIIGHAISFFLEIIFGAIILAGLKIFLEQFNLSVAKVFKYFLLAVCAIIFLADIFALCYYDTPVNRTMLKIILATNPQEATEFFSVYVFSAKFLVIFFSSAIIFFILNKISLSQINEKVLVVILIIVLIAVVRQVKRSPQDFILQTNSIGRMAIILPEVLQDMRDYENFASHSRHEVNLTRNESNLPLVIFVLGESATRNHWQLYGYNLPTTPNLNDLNSENSLKIFSDTVSPHAHTMQVLQKIFTFYRRENDSEGEKFWLEKENIFDILNAAGYHTAWISNQEMGGIYGNIGRFYSEICATKKFTQLRDSVEQDDAKFDEEILPLFDEELKNLHEKNFFVLHLMGSHSRYKLRYPKSFEKFFPADESDKNKTRAEYDNSILYTDFVLNQIVERVKNFDSIVIYVSDHGEDVFDDKNFSGHAEDNPSKFMIEVPFVIYTSEKFRDNHSELEKKISAAVDKPFMSDDMIYFLLDMLKIETADFDSTLSPLNENYNSDRQRIFSGKIYDKERGLQ